MQIASWRIVSRHASSHLWPFLLHYVSGGGQGPLAQTEGGVEQLEANCYAMFDSGIWLRDRTGLQQLHACECLDQN